MGQGILENWGQRARAVTGNTDPTEFTLCPEKVIDELLFRAEIGVLRHEDLFSIIEDCQLSAPEVEQLIEYLWLKGLDLPDIDLPQFYNHIRDFVGARISSNRKDWTRLRHPRYYSGLRYSMTQEKKEV